MENVPSDGGSHREKLILQEIDRLVKERDDLRAKLNRTEMLIDRLTEENHQMVWLMERVERYEAVKDGTKQYFHPIFHWSDEDVWGYIRSRGIPYCSLYDEGFKRLGCICCPMQKPEGRVREGDRWPRFKAQYIRTFQKMLDKKIADGLDVGEWRTGQDVWDWWTSPPPVKEDEAQMMIFE